MLFKQAGWLARANMKIPFQALDDPLLAEWIEAAIDFGSLGGTI